MIKIENIDVVGWEAAVRGMRNPMNSWKKSDSKFYRDPTIGCCGPCPCMDIEDDCECYFVGFDDLNLMMKLRNAGTDHRKFMRMITVYMDITAPLYWWKEFDTYKVGTVANSCSTMHKITDKELTLDDFSCEHLMTSGMDILMRTIKNLNDCRNAYAKYAEWNNYGFKKPTQKDIWWQMIQLLPSSYNQRRTVMLNYEVLANMYDSRKNHKLDEWADFCKRITTLPYSELITGLGLLPIEEDLYG